MQFKRLILILSLALIPLMSNAKLRSGEIAIEFRLKDGKYSAVVNRSGWKEPKDIPLCDTAKLEVLPVDHTLYNDANAQKAYEYILKPLATYLKKGDVIYFTPAGRINLFNLAALEDEKGRRLCERYHFFRVFDINEIPEDLPKHKYYTVLLYGGMKYDADFASLNEQGWWAHQPEFGNRSEDFKPSSPGLFDLGTTEDGTRAGFSKLKHSEEEIKFISDLGGWVSHPRTGAAAMEEVFRQDVSRDHEYIAHISTHTFNREDGILPDDHVLIKVDKTFASCGLLFSGAQHTLDGEQMPYAYDSFYRKQMTTRLNDGMLYGAEIARLDMSHCDLLVLAACNTALGIVRFDGVIGLQTAFKVAGVKTTLMTLWSVNDKATCEFMKRFYTYLFSGKSKHESLERARADLMNSEDFSDPIYWAPLIMID